MSVAPDPQLRKLLTLSTQRQAHLIGICGSGMRSLADFLLSAGWQLTGSDQSLRSREERGFAARGMTVWKTPSPQQVSPAHDLVVYSLAIPENHPERQQARHLGMLSCSYVEMLGQLFSLQQSLGIAGTHGKTTTTCLLDHLFRSAGEWPSLIGGGRIQGESQFGRQGTGNWLIGECCEFRQAFLQMRPHLAALLAVEADHFDCYPDESALLAAFSGFCGNIAPDGLLVVNADYPLAVQAASAARCGVEFYTLKQKSAELPTIAAPLWRAEQIEQTSAGSTFTMAGQGGKQSYQLPLYGQHQIGNAMAAICLARAAGLAESAISLGIRTFPGVERRFHERIHSEPLVVIDDYAHHPTEISATLSAARQKYPAAHLTVAFQPHQILRTQSLLPQFAAALADADRVLILPIFAARESADERVVQLAQELILLGNRLQPVFEYCPSLDHLRSMLDDKQVVTHNQQQTLFLTLGAGDIDRIFYELPG